MSILGAQNDYVVFVVALWISECSRKSTPIGDKFCTPVTAIASSLPLLMLATPTTTNQHHQSSTTPLHAMHCASFAVFPAYIIGLRARRLVVFKALLHVFWNSTTGHSSMAGGCYDSSLTGLIGNTLRQLLAEKWIPTRPIRADYEMCNFIFLAVHRHLPNLPLIHLLWSVTEQQTSSSVVIACDEFIRGDTSRSSLMSLQWWGDATKKESSSQSSRRVVAVVITPLRDRVWAQCSCSGSCKREANRIERSILRTRIENWVQSFYVEPTTMRCRWRWWYVPCLTFNVCARLWVSRSFLMRVETGWTNSAVVVK